MSSGTASQSLIPRHNLTISVDVNPALMRAQVLSIHIYNTLIIKVHVCMATYTYTYSQLSATYSHLAS